MEIDVQRLVEGVDLELGVNQENSVIWPFLQLNRIGHCIFEPWMMDHLYPNAKYSKKYVLLPPPETIAPCNIKIINYMFSNWEKIYSGNKYIFMVGQSGFNNEIFCKGKKYIFSNGKSVINNFYQYYILCLFR